MISPWYIVGVALTAGAVTFALRALPFALLRPLRESVLVARLAAWMPAGVLSILALVMLLDAAALAPGRPVDGRRIAHAAIAAAVTLAVHLLAGRRTLLSIAVGTLVYVGLVTLA